MEKILSIIIPMYNSYAYIEKCLDSLILDEKHMQLLEVIVVNDGSTDNCQELVQPYVQKYPNSMKLISQNNGGHGAAINTGVDACSGMYFKALDADDWFVPSSLSVLIDQMQKMSRADMILNSYQTHDIQTGETHSFEVGEPRTLFMQDVVENWQKYKWLFSFHGIIYYTDFYRKLGWRLPEKVYYDDAFFYTVYASYANKIAVLDRSVLYVYRVGDINQSISNKNRENRIHQLETVIDSILETYAEQDQRSCYGQQYWIRKTVTAISDYYITSYLRFENRKSGRLKAKKFTKKIKGVYPEIFALVRKKYWVLRMMGILRMDDEDLRRIVKRG